MNEIGKKKIIKPSPKGNLARVHPTTGGVNIDFGGQCFHGVSSDLFLGFDINDPSQTYQNTRKLNLSISINPGEYSTAAFLSFLTQNGLNNTENVPGCLTRTKKCKYHGDAETGLRASVKLLKMLSYQSFDVDGLHYEFDSIGVACNESYGSVGHRKGNAFKNSSSHFEIKFKKLPADSPPYEYLCLNIHLKPKATQGFGKSAALQRLEQAIGLFYAELGLQPSYKCSTALKQSLTMTEANYKQNGFGCKHKHSQEVLEDNILAKSYRHGGKENEVFSLLDYLKAPKQKKGDTQLKRAAPQLAHAMPLSAGDLSKDEISVKPTKNAWNFSPKI